MCQTGSKHFSTILTFILIKPLGGRYLSPHYIDEDPRKELTGRAGLMGGGCGVPLRPSALGNQPLTPALPAVW